MAYDEELSARMRTALEGHVGISEKKMMGGMCFLLEGNMIGGADRDAEGRGRFMFRVGKVLEAEALARDGAEIVEMGGRRFGGMVFVAEEACETDAASGTDEVLADWLALTLQFTTTLPAKS